MKGSERGRRRGTVSLKRNGCNGGLRRIQNRNRKRAKEDREGGRRESLPRCRFSFYFILFHLSFLFSFFLLPSLILLPCRFVAPIINISLLPRVTGRIVSDLSFFHLLLLLVERGESCSSYYALRFCLPSSSREHHPRPDHPSGDASLADYKQ